ncbi:MAG: GNAT family N-acetyltransferase [Hyphomicrobiales bacterium]
MAAALEQGLEARIIGTQAASDMAAAWRDLFKGCADANPFYGPHFLLPLLALGGKLARTRFVVVSSGPELVALCPIMPRGFAFPGLASAVGTLSHAFIFNALPLLREGYERRGWRAILDALEARQGRGVLDIDTSPLDGVAATSLMEALAESGRASLVIGRSERAGIVATGSADAHLARIKARTMTKLRRQERLLAELGEIGFRTAMSGQALAEAVDGFLALEARGWKGRQGSAFASDPRTASFAREALASGGDAPGVRIELLTLDGRPVGACLHLVAPAYSATFKIAHDEELSRQAPGVLAMLGSLKALLAEPWTQRLDSGAGPEDAVGAVWRDRIPTGRILAALSPRQGERELRLYAKAGALVEDVRTRAREAYYALTGRKRTRARKARG